jgi:hypothetical protein
MEQVMYSVTKEGFVHVPITDEILAVATQKANELGILRNSIRSGGGNLVGFLGEEICLRSVFDLCEPSNTEHHDFVWRDGDKITRFEVKSKQRTSTPHPHYEASVADFNAKQKTDFYVFTTIVIHKPTGVYTDGYIMGMMSPADYKAKSIFRYAGDIDPSNGWVVSADCHNLPYSRMTTFEKFSL